jgi:hypothetical protein
VAENTRREKGGRSDMEIKYVGEVITSIGDGAPMPTKAGINGLRPGRTML